MGIDKLAKFLEMEPEELRTQLLIFKQKSRQQKWISGTLLEGEYVTTSDLDFCLKEVKYVDAPMNKQWVYQLY